MKLSYFKLGEAFEEVKNAFSYGSVGEKAGVIAKLTAKTVANVGLLAVDLSVDIIKNAPEHIAKTVEKEKNKK